MRAARLNLTVSEEFIAGLTAVCNELGVSKSYFVEDLMAFIVEDFITDLEGSGTAMLIDFVEGRVWTRTQAKRMAAIMRGLPRPFVGVTITESKEHPNYWEVLSVRKEVV